MAYEKRWVAVAPKLLIADGGIDGKIEVADAIELHVKQVVFLKGDTLPNKKVQINAIESQTEIFVGPLGSNINTREDVSAYTVALNSTIEAEIQNRPGIPDKEFERASFEEEPVVAKRVIQVDPYGNKYTKTNTFPVTDADSKAVLDKINNKLADGNDIGDVTINNTASNPVEVSPSGNLLFGVKYDDVRKTSPSPTVDVWTYKLDTVVVATVTMTYTDATHRDFVSGVRT